MSNFESLMTKEEWSRFGFVPLSGVKLVLPNLPDQYSDVIRGDMVLVQGMGRRFYDLIDGERPLGESTSALIYLGFAKGDLLGEESYIVYAWAHFDDTYGASVMMRWEGEVVNPLGRAVCCEVLAQKSGLVFNVYGPCPGDDYLARFSEVMCRFCSVDLGRAIELNSHRLPGTWTDFGKFLRR